MRDHPAILAEKIVISMGIPIHVSGFRYFCEAVSIALSDHSKLGHMTKDIYPVIAEKYGVSPQTVARCIANAVQMAWEQDNSTLRYITSRFRMGVSDKRPTPSELLAIATLETTWFI